MPVSSQQNGIPRCIIFIWKVRASELVHLVQVEEEVSHGLFAKSLYSLYRLQKPKYELKLMHWQQNFFEFSVVWLLLENKLFQKVLIKFSL